MGFRDTNPYIDTDLKNIIGAYANGANQQDTEESVFAILTPETIETKSFANEVIKRIESYNTREDVNPSFNFAGLEIQNTVNTILEADSVGEALKTAASDCIPCEDRLLALLNLSPLDELVDMLERDLARRFQLLYSMIDLLNNIDIFNDICLLLQQLNFMCVPDLQRIALILTLLLNKYKDKLNLTITLPEALIGGIMGPFLSSVNILLDQYVQLILGPIECVIDELNYQVQKLDISEGIARAEQQTGTADQENPRSLEGAIPNISDPIKGATTESLGNALLDLVNYLEQGRSYVDSLLNFVREQLDELMKTAHINSQIRISDALNKLHLLRLISLITSIIEATRTGDLNCRDLESVDSSKKLETFLNNYIRPNTDIRINLDESKDTITVQSPQIDNVQSNTIAEIFTNAQQDLPITNGSRIVDGQPIEQTATILIKNCLYDVDKQDLEKVKHWISEFEKEV